MADIGDDDYIFNSYKFSLVTVLDVSKSMKNHIGELNAAYNKFIELAQSNDDMRLHMDMAVLAFSEDCRDMYKELSGHSFTDVNGLRGLEFQADKCSNIPKALETAYKLIHNRVQQYTKLDMLCRMPCIVLMSDGLSTNYDRKIIETLNKKVDEGKVQVYVIAVGEDLGMELLKKIAHSGNNEPNRLMKLNEWDFDSFFNWLGKMSANMSSPSPKQFSATLFSGDRPTMDELYACGDVDSLPDDYRRGFV